MVAFCSQNSLFPLIFLIRPYSTKLAAIPPPSNNNQQFPNREALNTKLNQNRALIPNPKLFSSNFTHDAKEGYDDGDHKDCDDGDHKDVAVDYGYVALACAFLRKLS
ncbi:unnamed protein product [Vicia faba]|uniref:Uncharacterized protein n=1 Tax=Vicia faba TaxID=3906 RepID=A0AAV1ABC7_VICFA|nr:unnamed protein product [Vicia faba]